MKKKMTNRDIKIILIFGAILILAASYFLVFSKFNTKKAEMKAKNDVLNAEVQELETMRLNEAGVRSETESFQQQIAETLSQFPTEVRTQNAIYDLHKMYTSIDDVKIQSESYNMNQIFYQQEGAAADPAADPNQAEAKVMSGPAVTEKTAPSEIVSAAANYTGYRSDVAVAFTAPYNSMKRIVDYINDAKNRMTISDISATKDMESDLLTCSMTVSMYAISGTGEYEAPEITESDPIGKGNSIFDK